MKMLWIDLETGGTDPRDYDITEIAGIIDIDGVAVDEFQLLIRPHLPQRVSRDALALQHRTLDEVMAHPYGEREAWSKLKYIFGQHVNQYNPDDKFIWAGHTSKFDMDFTRAMWKHQGDVYFGSWFESAPVDLASLAVAMHQLGYLPEIRNNKLQTIALATGALSEGAKQTHTAIDDIRIARESWYRLLAMLPRSR